MKDGTIKLCTLFLTAFSLLTLRRQRPVRVKWTSVRLKCNLAHNRTEKRSFQYKSCAKCNGSLIRWVGGQALMCGPPKAMGLQGPGAEFWWGSYFAAYLAS